VIRRRDRRTAHYQRLGEDFLRRMDQRTAARCAAIRACHDGPDAMAALLDDLGKRIAAEQARHGIPTDGTRARSVRHLAKIMGNYGEHGYPPVNSCTVNGRQTWRAEGEDVWTFAARALTNGALDT